MAAQGTKILALDEKGQLHLLHADPDKSEVLDASEIVSSPTAAMSTLPEDQSASAG